MTIRHPKEGELASELQKHRITVDARGEHLRICPDILNGAEDLDRAAHAIRRALGA